MDCRANVGGRVSYMGMRMNPSATPAVDSVDIGTARDAGGRVLNEIMTNHLRAGVRGRFDWRANVGGRVLDMAMKKNPSVPPAVNSDHVSDSRNVGGRVSTGVINEDCEVDVFGGFERRANVGGRVLAGVMINGCEVWRVKQVEGRTNVGGRVLNIGMRKHSGTMSDVALDCVVQPVNVGGRVLTGVRNRKSRLGIRHSRGAVPAAGSRSTAVSASKAVPRLGSMSGPVSVVGQGLWR